MRRLKRFLRLSKPERAILLQAAFSIVCVRFLLCVFPLGRVQRFACRSTWRSERTCTADHIVWAIHAAARIVPGSTCLIRSLAAHALLNRFGYKPVLTIGVAKNNWGRLEAHAWVSCEGQLLIGGPCVERYHPLVNFRPVS